MSHENKLPTKAKTMPLSSSDTIKRLIHSASILVKQLDSIITKAKTCRDLFTPEAIELRSQLSHLCAKSVVADPSQCRRKAEELLWKKCFYDVISAAKLNSKKSSLTLTDKFYLESHIDIGISKFSENLQDALAKLKSIHPSSKLCLNIFPSQSKKSCLAENNESKEDLLDSIQRILIWLGDLSRYRNDLQISSSTITAHRLYKQAVIVNPTIGLPFNQLGTLTSHDSNRCFESMFYYMRSLKSSKPFPGAGPNLKTLLNHLSSSEDKLVVYFSQLLSHLALDRKEGNPAELGQSCQVTLVEIQRVLQFGEENHDRVLNLVGAAMLCITHVDSHSNQSTAAIAFCCSLFSHVLTAFQHIFGLNSGQPTSEVAKQNASPNEEDSSDEEEEETKRAKMRRRKIGSECSDQEFSEEDEEIFLDTDDSDQESEEDEALSDSGFNSADTRTQPLSEIPPKAVALLPLFKSMTDWFQTNAPIVRVSSLSVRKMWVAFARVLNAFKRFHREDVELHKQTPLEEDWKFYGMSGVSAAHAKIDFNASPMLLSISTSTSIRIERILSFGAWLVSEGSEIDFKYENGVFSCSVGEENERESTNTDGPAEETDKKEDLMRNMAHLWLKSEVRELERKLSPQPTRRKNKKNNWNLFNLPFVFLVPDVTALIDYTQLIKQIVKSQKLIVVIPNVVISEMDQLKKESSSARDCIRWLETCFKNGNRFVRAQRSNEHQIIPLLIYPKRKDKANWILFQIFECCHYLDTYQRQIYKNSQNAPIVLFLTGNSEDETDQQTKGVCSSIGVELKTAGSLTRKGKSKKS